MKLSEATGLLEEFGLAIKVVADAIDDAESDRVDAIDAAEAAQEELKDAEKELSDLESGERQEVKIGTVIISMDTARDLSFGGRFVVEVDPIGKVRVVNALDAAVS